MRWPGTTGNVRTHQETHLPPACEKPPDPQVSLKMSEVVCRLASVDTSQVLLPPRSLKPARSVESLVVTNRDQRLARSRSARVVVPTM